MSFLASRLICISMAFVTLSLAILMGTVIQWVFFAASIGCVVYSFWPISLD